MKNIGIIGLNIHSLFDDPQITLPGNPVRSWAIFRLLENYGFITDLYIGPKATVEASIKAGYGDRLIVDHQQFIENTKKKYDALIICGTKLKETLSHHPWISEVVNIPIFLALCAHDKSFEIPQTLKDNIIGATFVSPRHAHLWQQAHPKSQTGIMAHGQIAKPAVDFASQSDVILLGHIHSIEYLFHFIEIARLDPNRKYHLVTSKINRLSRGGDYIYLGRLADDQERGRIIDEMVSAREIDLPKNLFYHYLPPGSEAALLDNCSIGIDFSWHQQWHIDNSKVCNYLSWGLQVICERPALSFRFVQRHNAGKVLAFGASPSDWVAAIHSLGPPRLEEKNRIRLEAAGEYSWDRAVFDLAVIMIDYFDRQSR